MTGLLESILLWGKAVLFGVLASVNILYQIVTKGPGKVLSWKKLDRPTCLDDPALGTHGFLTLKDGVRIHYVASGPENKPLMLFVHGFPEFWYSWRYQIREFQKDFRVVAIDQRGYSESSKPQGIENYSISKLESDLEQVIQALGYKSCTLIAHDWGGIVSWGFARHFPHLVHKVIVLNAPPFPIFKRILQKNKNQAKKSWYIYFFQLPFLPELSFRLGNFALFDSMLPSKGKSRNFGNTETSKEENIFPYKYIFSQDGALTAPMNYYRYLMRNDSDKNANHDLEYTMPALLIWGCQDKALDISIPETIEKDVPKIEVKRIPEANHFVQLDAPDKVNEILREWLTKN